MGFVKYGLIFVFGAAAGAGSVYYVMNKKIKDANEATQKAVDQVKASYSQSEKNQELKKQYTFATVEEEPSDDVMRTYDDVVEAIKEYYERPVDISLISAEEFESNEEDTHMFLTYYKKDNMVVYSDTLIPMENPEDILGEFFKDSFEESDVIYIKNEKEGALYELLIDEVNSLSDGEGIEEEDGE